MKVSFDYDGTILEHSSIQSLAKILVDSGNDVYIITSRSPLRNNIELTSLANLLGIKPENIYFVDMDAKVNKIKELEIDIHIDDMEEEIKEILKHYPKCIGLQVGRNWDFLI
jgi:hypothetical protein